MWCREGVAPERPVLSWQLLQFISTSLLQITKTELNIKVNVHPLHLQREYKNMYLINTDHVRCPIK